MTLDAASVRAVAKKDFQDAVRSRLLWALSVLFILFAGGMAYLYTEIQNASGNELAALDLIFFLQSPVGLLIPLTGLLLGYKSVAGEIETGSVKILLSLPHSRGSVLLGKLFGRTGVLTVPILVGFAVAAVVVLALYPVFTAKYYLAFVAVTILFGLAYVSIAVAISAMTKSTSRAAVGIVSAFVAFNMLWEVIGYGIHYVVTLITEGDGVFFPGFANEAPTWFLFYQRLSPNGAFGGALTSALPRDSSFSEFFPSGDVPFYLADWFSLVILALWVIVPLYLGYLRFDAADL